MMKGIVEKVGGALTPPELRSNAELAWRLTVSASIFGLIIIISSHLAWTVGFWPGSSGFAMATEVDEVKRLQLETRIERIEASICRSIDTDVVIDRELIRLRDELQRKYRDANKGEPYSVPPCEILAKLQ